MVRSFFSFLSFSEEPPTSDSLSFYIAVLFVWGWSVSGEEASGLSENLLRRVVSALRFCFWYFCMMARLHELLQQLEEK